MRIFLRVISLLLAAVSLPSFGQNKEYTDSLIKVVGQQGVRPEKQQALYEEIIGELAEYDSAQAEKYLAYWKNNFYRKGKLQKIFYHKNRGVLLLNYSNYQAALSEVSTAISFYPKDSREAGLADLFNNRANILSDMERDESALADYETAILMYRKLGLKKDEALALSNKANLYGTKGNFKEAVPYALQALKIREQAGDEQGVATTSFNLAIMFKNLGRYEEALDYLVTAEKYYQKIKNEKSMATVLLVRGSVYRSQKKYELSKASFLKAVPILEKYDFRGGLVNAYENLGTLSALADENEIAALSYYQQAEKIVEALHNVQGRISTGINIAQSLLSLKRYPEFLEKVSSIEQLARTHNYTQELQEILKLRLLYAFDKSADAAAKEYLSEFEKIRDSVNGSDIQSQLSDLKIKYDTEKKEEQIKLLHSRNELQKQILAKNQLALVAKELELDKQNLQIGNQELTLKNQDALLANNNLQLKNREQKINILSLSNKNKNLKIQEKNRQIIYGIGAFLFLLALGFLNYYRLRMRQRARLQQAIIDEQDKSAKAIIGAEENERSRMSQHLHDGLGQLLSAAKMNLQGLIERLPPDEKTTKIYSNTLQLVDESIAEMRSVSHQLVTNNVIRKGLGVAMKELVEKIDSDRLRVVLEVKGLLQAVPQDIQLIVYRILQESIQNVVKHADARRIDIRMEVGTDRLSASIKDDGKGFDPAIVRHRTGIGLENIQTRVRFLKGTYNMVSSPNQGTSLEFEFPLTA